MIDTLMEVIKFSFFQIVPDLIAFVVVVALSIPIGGKLVDRLCNRWSEFLVGHYRMAKPDGVYSEIAGRIGRIERVLYIFATMKAQYGLITSWVILKVVYNWLRLPDSTGHGQSAKLDTDTESRRLQGYAIGSLISLLVGLALGEAAVFLAKIFRLTINSP